MNADAVFVAVSVPVCTVFVSVFPRISYVTTSCYVLLNLVAWFALTRLLYAGRVLRHVLPAVTGLLPSRVIGFFLAVFAAQIMTSMTLGLVEQSVLFYKY